MLLGWIGRTRLGQIRIKRPELTYANRVPEPIGCDCWDIPEQGMPELLETCLDTIAYKDGGIGSEELIVGSP